MTALDATDRALLRATQEGLPLTPRPYHAVAERLGLDPEDVMARFRRLLAAGVIRRMGAVPNHYGLGVRANGMSVWDVDDGRIAELGPRVGELPFVTHCYRRPRHLPLWPYNLFAMVHGRARDEVEAKVGQIALVLGAAARGRDVLYSSRILKKTGLRLTG
jgi:siroheme decarboxylase